MPPASPVSSSSQSWGPLPAVSLARVPRASDTTLLVVAFITSELHHRLMPRPADVTCCATCRPGTIACRVHLAYRLWHVSARNDQGKYHVPLTLLARYTHVIQGLTRSVSLAGDTMGCGTWQPGTTKTVPGTTVVKSCTSDADTHFPATISYLAYLQNNLSHR